MIRLLGLSGSLRAASTNTLLLRGLQARSPAGVSLEIFEGLGGLPLFSPDLEARTPDAVQRLGAAVGSSDGIVIAAPEYAHGIPGGLKNALDWLVSRDEIPGKPVMLVHASTRSQTSRDHLREVLTTMSCRLYRGPEFEVHLIGRDAEACAAILAAPEQSAAMESALGDFARFIVAGE